MTRKAFAALAITATLALAGCGGGLTPGGSDGDGSNAATWPGKATDAGNGDSISIGTWKGKPNAVQITCSGPDGQVTATLTAPEGWTATTTQPEGGGSTGATITDSSGKSMDLKGEGSGAVKWGVTATFGTDWPLAEQVDNSYGGTMDKEDGWKFYAAEVSCER